MEEGESGAVADGEKEGEGGTVKSLSELVGGCREEESGNAEVREDVALVEDSHASSCSVVVNGRTSSEAEMSSEEVVEVQPQQQLPSTTCRPEALRHEQLPANGGLRQRGLERLRPSLADEPSLSSPDLRKTCDIGWKGDKSESSRSALFFSSLQERKAELLQRARR